MFAKKAQVATEYIIITGFILVVVTMIFTYSFVTNNQRIKISQANNALDKMINTADLVYALGPDNNQFIWVTIPKDLQLIKDITVCDDTESTWQGHYEPEDVSCGDLAFVKAGAIEMQLSLIGGLSTIRRPAKAEIELDIYCGDPVRWPACSPKNEIIQPTDGRQRIKAYWCGEKICLKRV